MHATNTGLQTMATSHHPPPPGRQHRPRRKSLEQLEAKYKALMRNMLMYQQMRKQNLAGGSGAGTGAGIKTETVAAGVRSDDKSQQHIIYQAQQTLPTPSSSVSPTSSTSNLEDTDISQQNQRQYSHPHQYHQNTISSLREQQRERPPQKRLQNTNSGPRPAYERRETSSSARHARPVGRSMPAAMQFAYEELASMQQQQQQVQTPPPQQQHQPPSHPHQRLHLFQPPAHQAQQPHQGSAPIPIPRPANIHIVPPYMQQQYAQHVSPHAHGHHQPLASPLPTPPHLTASYPAHRNSPTLSAPYTQYDNSGMLAHVEHAQAQQQQHRQQQQTHQHQHHPRHLHQTHHSLSYDPNGGAEGDPVLDYFVPNMGEI